ncbi:unnamed protein product [Oppiella nova]|uniref:JNK-interacting protein 1 n=1 Tax=Oppiella nova TaxID=334625 RepID=A0A7R9MFF6_9ACAR|nr:unnamed protein product [Oppiella nova]CAG2176363.1 unnamed protein product [Oppiella nova]
MADPQFQEFSKHFDLMPQHIKAPQQCYRLVPDIDIDLIDSPKEEINKTDMNCKTENNSFEGLWQIVSNTNGIPLCEELSNPQIKYYSQSEKCLIRQVSTNMFLEIRTDGSDGKPVSLKLFSRDPTLNTSQSPDEDDSSYKYGSDSGNSSAMSPTDESITCLNGISSQKRTEKLKSLKVLEATHRGLYKFIPRHSDELDIEIGDPIHLLKENEDMWGEGINLRTGLKGIFPSALVTDVEYSEFVVEANGDDSLPNLNFKVKKERFALDFLGSVEVTDHKGNPVLCESVRRVLDAKPSDFGMNTPQPSILEISDLGLRMTDNKPVATNSNSKVLNHDYFFALKHVTFCGFYPKDNRYFGFITKHPIEDRLACHVFRGCDSTREVTEAVGRAFHRFYNRFIELSYPIEEFYFE